MLTGLTGLYGLGMSYGGPVAVIWGWPLVSFFTTAVALSMAEICRWQLPLGLELRGLGTCVGHGGQRTARPDQSPRMGRFTAAPCPHYRYARPAAPTPPPARCIFGRRGWRGRAGRRWPLG